jgi:hypothetical protein
VGFWVLVDGQLRFSATLAPVPPEAKPVDVALGPNDRFLTLATTAPGTCTFCWAMFAEPTLELETN